MDLRLEFVRRHLDGERLADLASEYGISLKTAKKFKARFIQLGEPGLLDQSKAPHWIPHKTEADVVRILVATRKKHPSWGPKKLKAVLQKKHGREFPAASTIGDILGRAGLIEKRIIRSLHTPLPTHLGLAKAPNDTWCIDYKGQFRLANGRYCYPLTVTDQFSRFIVGIEAMDAIDGTRAIEVCEELFRRFGLPSAMRSDNGSPFASRGLAGLTTLSAFWLQLGIRLERIRPGHPEENGRHERMHRTLKQETTKPRSKNELQQQERFDAFVDEFNNERPHESLAMKCPAEIYVESKRRYPAQLVVPKYEDADDILRVSKNGYISIGNKVIYVSTALGRTHVGVTEQKDGRLLVTFMDLDLGYVDRSLNRLLPMTA